MKTINVPTKMIDLKKDSVKYEKLYEDLTTWNTNGINTLNYNILKREDINEDTTQIVVDLLKKEDELKHKNWFPSPKNNYKDIERAVQEKWYDISIEYN